MDRHFLHPHLGAMPDSPAQAGAQTGPWSGAAGGAGSSQRTPRSSKRRKTTSTGQGTASTEQESTSMEHEPTSPEENPPEVPASSSESHSASASIWLPVFYEWLPIHDTYDYSLYRCRSWPRNPAPARTWLATDHGRLIYVAPCAAYYDQRMESGEGDLYEAVQHYTFHKSYAMPYPARYDDEDGTLLISDDLHEQPSLILKVGDTLFAVDGEELLEGLSNGEVWEREWAQRDNGDVLTRYGQPVLEIHPDVTVEDMEHHLRYMLKDKGRYPLFFVLDAREGPVHVDFEAALGLLRVGTLYEDKRARDLALKCLTLFFPSSAPRKDMPGVMGVTSAEEKEDFLHNHALRALPVLLQARAHAQIPAALYTAAQERLSTIVTSPESGSVMTVRRSLAAAFPGLCEYMVDRALLLLDGSTQPCKCTGGTSALHFAKKACREGRLDLGSGDGLRVNLLTRPDDMLVGNRFCKTCAKTLRVVLRRWEDAAWQRLPSICGYAFWDDVHERTTSVPRGALTIMWSARSGGCAGTALPLLFIGDAEPGLAIDRLTELAMSDRFLRRRAPARRVLRMVLRALPCMILRVRAPVRTGSVEVTRNGGGELDAGRPPGLALNLAVHGLNADDEAGGLGEMEKYGMKSAEERGERTVIDRISLEIGKECISALTGTKITPAKISGMPGSMNTMVYRVNAYVDKCHTPSSTAKSHGGTGSETP
ncbi:hypothetical protein K525DRAFT_284487 [Schizophyllum commune Loenen D]|nr:hypothetical protein K525DRAFT_284487 [Schizophyllum commune Loenen D]